MEPCELLPPPSTDKLEELMCDPVSNHQRSHSMTVTSKYATTSKFGSGRRATADFQSKPEASITKKTARKLQLSPEQK